MGFIVSNALLPRKMRGERCYKKKNMKSRVSKKNKKGKRLLTLLPNSLSRAYLGSVLSALL
jgi:hypothetical protein